MMNNKVLCIGFSVTEEREGYVKELQDILALDSISIEKFSIGGATFAVLPFFLHDLLSDHRGGVVLFEIATCYRFRKDIREYDKILHEIVSICEFYQCRPLFLNLYRSKVEYRSDLLVTAIESICARRGIVAIDLYNDIRYASDINVYLRDGVHTTPVGAKYYAQLAAPYIREVFNKNYKVFSIPSLAKAEHFDHLCRVGTFSRGGLETNYIEIDQANSVDFIFPEEILLCGIVYLMGPKAGVMHLTLPEKKFQRRIYMYDERSYYNRCSYSLIPEQACQHIRLEQLAERPDITLVKGKKYEGSLMGGVVGFLIRSITSLSGSKK